MTGRGYGDAVETVIVKDMTAPGALDEAMRDTVGVVHLASDVTFNPDPNEVITPIVNMARNILESASKTPSIKRFVYTSSSAALPQPDQEIHITPDSWVDSSIVDMAWAEPHTAEKGPLVYTASKFLGERACWDFVKEKKPHFEFNTVVPNANIGAFLDPRLAGSFNGIVYGLYTGDAYSAEVVKIFPPMFLVNLEDSALLHVAGLTFPDVVNERLLGIGDPFNADDVLAAIQKVDPSNTKLPPKNGNLPQPKATVDRKRAFELTARLGKPKWTNLEDSVRQNIESMSAAGGLSKEFAEKLARIQDPAFQENKDKNLFG